MTLVIGEISYTNILPLYYYLERNKLIENGCSFVPQIPSQLNEGMSKGVVDVGGISSFSYGEHFDKYHLLPNLSVSSHREVGSIFLFSKVPIEELNEKKIALTSSSATSINLLKVILHHFYQYQVDYHVTKPNFHEMMLDHDACLLIGDDAIVTKWNHEKDIYRYDLGQLWYEHTGFPMTYAVFAVRNQVIENQGALLEALYEQFLMSKKKSQHDQFQPMITEIRNLFGGSSSFWNEYFAGLCYDLEMRQLEGLRYYYKLAYEQGLLTKKVESIYLWDSLDHCHSI
ncbi:menaquinone biosynthetic enzyme MqnA/MqnD family protein [Bacillus sp. FJAT-45350]|uniref:menaquinone biosynthetic enzyme MqnA/MqnD family protein n=1 Tax=Bacillus sp. FJAT-45350 TaxID=2011014 RepID=UPI000BB89D2F|nr:menaquinone biosynthesis protein [Bacillus sp. FJAT-45350]